MTSLADALATARAHRPGPKCTVAVVLGSLPPEDRTALLVAIEDDTLPSSRLAAACKVANVPLGYSPISRHRAGGCSCPKAST